MSDLKGQATFAGAGWGERCEAIAARLASQEGPSVSVSFRHRWKAQDLIASGVLDADEAEVEGNIFERRQLPQVLRNVMRARDDAQREAKAMYLLREDANAALDRVTDEHLQARLVEEIDGLHEHDAASIVHLIEQLVAGVCQGDEHCKAPRHEHGCDADLDGSACNDPGEYHGGDGDDPAQEQQVALPAVAAGYPDASASELAAIAAEDRRKELRRG